MYIKTKHLTVPHLILLPQFNIALLISVHNNLHMRTVYKKIIYQYKSRLKETPNSSSH